MSHTLLCAYPYFKFGFLKWVSVKVFHEGLKWFFRFWHSFGYIINYFPIILIITLFLSYQLYLYMVTLLWFYSMNEGLGFWKPFNHVLKRWVVLHHHAIMKISINAEVMIEARVLVFMSPEGCHLSIFHHTNITLNNSLTWLPCSSLWSGKLFSKSHLSVNSHYDELAWKFAGLW